MLISFRACRLVGKNWQLLCGTFEGQLSYLVCLLKKRSLDKVRLLTVKTKRDAEVLFYLGATGGSTKRLEANASMCLISACAFYSLLLMKCLCHYSVQYWKLVVSVERCSPCTFLPGFVFLPDQILPSRNPALLNIWNGWNGIDECNINCTLWGLFIFQCYNKKLSLFLSYVWV